MVQMSNVRTDLKHRYRTTKRNLKEGYQSNAAEIMNLYWLNKDHIRVENKFYFFVQFFVEIYTLINS